ncbi:MAG: tetratricopeptide repeat protein [Thermoplasmata archaeon]
MAQETGGDVVPFVNRNYELQVISELLEESLRGKTTAILFKGDVGIGKTRLMEKTLEIAKEKGFEAGVGHGVKGVKIPFVSLTECFSALGMEHLLLPQKPPRVDCVYLMTSKGILLAKVERENFQIKPEIFAAMLALVNRFVKDSLKLIDNSQAGGGLGRMEYEGWWIVIEKLGDLHLVAILSGRETEFLIEDMRNALFNIQKKYGGILRNWNGDMDAIAGVENEFSHIITSGKYDGIDYGTGDFAAQRTNLFENVIRGVRRRATEKPLLIVIENIHWADESTISVISYIVQNIRNSRLCVLLTTRNHELTGTFAEDVISELMNTGRLIELELCELGRAPSIEILNHIASGIGENEEVVNEILSETGGNPLFLIEVTRYMLHENELVYGDEGWQIVKKREHRLPRKIEEIFRKKLSMLRDARELVECGAIMGDNFQPEIIAHIFGMEKFQVLKKLREVEENSGLLTFSDNECSFEHTLAREIIYQSIPQPMRKEYHEKIAETMEKLYNKKPGENLSRIGYHYYMAGNTGKALPYLLKGIRNAEVKFANAEALQLINYAKELAEKDEGLREVYMSLLEKEGDIYQITGKYRKAIEVYSRILTIVSTPERIYRKMGECANAMGDYDRALEYVSKGLEKIQKANPEYGRLKLLEGTIHYRKGEIEEAHQIYLEVLSTYEEYGAEEKDRALLLNNLGNVYFEKRELRKALDYYRMSLAIREKIEDYLAVGGSYNNIGVVYRYMHEYTTALAYFQKSLRQAEKCGYTWAMIFPLDNMAELYFAIGELKKSIDAYKTEINILRKIGNRYAIINTYGKLAKNYAKHGMFDNAMECLVESGNYVLKTNEPLFLASHFLAHVAVYREQEKYERAIEFAEKALVEAKRAKNDERAKILILNALSDKAENHYLAGNTKEAERICVSALERFPGTEIAKGAGYIYITYGKIIATPEKLNEARGFFRRGIEALTFYGGEYRIANALLAWGKIEKEIGDKNEAYKLLDRALKLFSLMQIKKKIEEIRALMTEN